MAHSVCDGDVRSMDQRRAHALAAKVNGTALTCRCGDPDCQGGTAGDAPVKNAVVYAVVDNKAVDDHKVEHTTAAEPGPGPAEAATKPSLARLKPGYVFGAGILPTALLGGIVERATIREVRHPGGNSPPEPRYTPSRQLAEFVRCRDLTCRYPGCDKPAQVCEIDHTVPYPVGPTHPSNLKCLCGFHHMLKTFWVGRDGWSEKQRPDGTVIWTLPTGHTRTTYPGSLHLFPQLCQPTASLWPGEPPVVEAVA